MSRTELAGSQSWRQLLGMILGVVALVSTPSARIQAQGPPPSVHGRSVGGPAAFPMPPGFEHLDLNAQSDADVSRKSTSCVQCHQGVGNPHGKNTVRLGCIDCHGGNPNASDKATAHVAPRFPEFWASSANPVRSYTLLNHEDPEFIRFVNPGDLRVNHISCGTSGCHGEVVMQVRKSMMTTGAMLWEAALYNNGAIIQKRAPYGESYSMHGAPQRVQTVPPPSEYEIRVKGVLPYLDPLPKYEVSQPGNILRIFERGRLNPQEVGLPNPSEAPGRPLAGLSSRGLGTKNRTDPTMLGLQKTRLLDPTLNFLGTNDQPGDYRSSGCTSCHVVYANDRSPVHSGPFAQYGNRGLSFSADPMIPKNEPGHPIDHKFVWAPPTSQCMVCHIHPGTTVMNSYVGFMWWDEETDGHAMYPKHQVYPTAEQYVASQMRNPNESAARRKDSNPEFVTRISELNPELQHTQFADFHGHGWTFRAVWKHDRKGNLLDAGGDLVPEITSEKLLAAMAPPTPHEREAGKEATRPGVPLHQMDIHMEKGMHCVDCHFAISGHGNGKLYGEVRNAVEIECIDCHGTASKVATLLTSGPASPEKGLNLATLRTPFGKRRFERREDGLYQNSMVEEGLAWRVKQTADTVTPGTIDYNEKSHLAKTVRWQGDQLVWGNIPGGNEAACAHSNDNMTCQACHSSWNPSCYGCHLPQKANRKTPELHNNGDVTRNIVHYNFQTLRDDVFMLARDGDVTGNKVNPSRSSCAIHVGSYNGIRESIYNQQQTISAEGLSGIAFSTNVPHTVRGGPPRDEYGRSINPSTFMPGRNETKQCTDCHVSQANDNNAIMAQLLMQGTQYLNFIGRYCWVAEGEHGIEAVIVTEREEPQAVIGSSLHEMAFPDYYEEFVEAGRELEHSYDHPTKDIIENLVPRFRKPKVHQLVARGEYVYAACGENGLRVMDIAFIDDKGFSERITTAPVSPLGQRFYVRTKYATAVAAPATTAPDPTRKHYPDNKEPNVPLAYAFIYVGDKYEGLILVGAGTLLDGNPLNNFLKREATFNPDGLLNGVTAIKLVGTYAYVTCDAGLVVVDVADPKKLHITQVIGHEFLNEPNCVDAQFRYAFVTDHDGVKILDCTDIAHPRPAATFPLREAHSVYVARTYAYVAAGSQGLVILDVENPAAPRLDQVYDANGQINDAHDVKLGITYVSEFAYIADGKNGLRVVQLTSPETPGNDGFSPRPTPKLVATRKLEYGGEALYVAKGVDRDRAVDESGHQLSVFGRIGARPLNQAEQQQMYLKDGRLWRVSDDPRNPGYQYVGPQRRPAGTKGLAVKPGPSLKR